MTRRSPRQGWGHDDTADPDNGTATAYRYNPFGRRIAKIADAGGTPQVTYYFYDGSHVCEEQDAAGTTTTYVHGGYVDEVLTMQRGGRAVLRQGW